MLYNEARPATKTTAININYVNDIIRVLSFECFVVTLLAISVDYKQLYFFIWLSQQLIIL